MNFLNTYTPPSRCLSPFPFFALSERASLCSLLLGGVLFLLPVNLTAQNVGDPSGSGDSIWMENGNVIHNVDMQKDVGIGTDQPARKLDVAGDARIRGLGGDSLSLVVSDRRGNLDRLPVERPIRDIIQPTPSQNNKAAQALNAFSFYGNSGLDPSQHFLGMKDATDLVIRTNNTERMRVRADGVTEVNDLSAQSRIQGDYLQGNNHRIAYVTPDGKLIGPGDPPATNGCAPPVMDGWVEGQDHDDIRLCTDYDSLGIGTDDPNAQLHVKKDAPSILIEDGIQENGTDATSRMTLKANDTSSSLASSHSIDMILKGDISEERFKVVQQLGAVNTSSKKLFSVGNVETIVHNSAIFKGLSVFNKNATFKEQAHFKDITLFDQKAVFYDKVAINTTNLPPSFKLAVDGKVIAEEFWTDMSQDWPQDTVFKPGYSMLTFNELRDSIRTKQHLPHFPSAEEYWKKGKLNLEKVQSKQLQSLEEAYVYILKLEKRVRQLEKENEQLKQTKKELKTLKQQITSLKQQINHREQ